MFAFSFSLFVCRKLNDKQSKKWCTLKMTKKPGEKRITEWNAGQRRSYIKKMVMCHLLKWHTSGRANRKERERIMMLKNGQLNKWTKNKWEIKINDQQVTKRLLRKTIIITVHSIKKIVIIFLFQFHQYNGQATSV